MDKIDDKLNSILTATLGNLFSMRVINIKPSDYDIKVIAEEFKPQFSQLIVSEMLGKGDVKLEEKIAKELQPVLLSMISIMESKIINYVPAEQTVFEFIDDAEQGQKLTSDVITSTKKDFQEMNEYKPELNRLNDIVNELFLVKSAELTTKLVEWRLSDKQTISPEAFNSKDHIDDFIKHLVGEEKYDSIKDKIPPEQRETVRLMMNNLTVVILNKYEALDRTDTDKPMADDIIKNKNDIIILTNTKNKEINNLIYTLSINLEELAHGEEKKQERTKDKLRKLIENLEKDPNTKAELAEITAGILLSMRVKAGADFEGNVAEGKKYDFDASFAASKADVTQIMLTNILAVQGIEYNSLDKLAGKQMEDITGKIKLIMANMDKELGEIIKNEAGISASNTSLEDASSKDPLLQRAIRIELKKQMAPPAPSTAERETSSALTSTSPSLLNKLAQALISGLKTIYTKINSRLETDRAPAGSHTAKLSQERGEGISTTREV